MQIGKNLQLPFAVLLKVSHFLDDVTRGTIRRVNIWQMRISAILVLYSGSETLAYRRYIVPYLNVGLLPDAATREVIAIDSFRVASPTKR